MTTDAVQLRFVNLSADGGTSNIVFFQKNQAAGHDAAVAWRVVRRCGYGNYCPIPYGWMTEINMVDWNANHSARQMASPGDVFHIVPQRYGKSLMAMANDGYPTEIAVQNRLSRGAPDVDLYRAGCTVARQRNLIPGSWAKFNLPHRLYVADMPEVKQGQSIPSRFLVAPATEFCLYGVAAADIVMLGGEGSIGLRFEMMNVVAR